ncbi:MAG: hypothetical protein CMI71_01000 [Candidatus Pelagibacter sp.]|nr:hypothetical protein [Candidatus Pelagibacter sp.]|tara:strand:+ start:831 stop:1448 length:618 start_codon:yes stop_codon:yes gene_type:complete
MDEIKNLVLLISAGFLFRTALIFTGQLWAKSHAQTVSFLVLPIITYIITNTIANNIALSLGMIGALSIVRFRHPVKSPLELVMYFALITVGIATSVRTKWAIQLIVVTLAIILIVKLFQILAKKYGKSFYNMSFNEGVSTNTLEITSKGKIDFVEKNEFLISSFNDVDEKKVIYRLNFESREDLQAFKENLNKADNIEKINVIYN